MARPFHCTIEVRGYELDSFGHVNHAVYVSYFEHARWHVLRDSGITLETFRQWGLWPVISRIEIDYLKPSYLGDPLEILTQVVENSRTSFTFSQTILRREEKIATARVKAVMINERGRPSALPREIERLWLKNVGTSP